MRLYSGSSKQFIQDTIQNQIAEKLKLSFFNYFRYNPSPAEINSWRNSLRAICQVFQHTDLYDHGVILEYQLPLTSKRLDCLVCGKDKNKSDNAIIIELKQWDKCEDSNCENEVLTWVGGAKREVLHPSVQVGQYKMYLQDTHTAFYADADPITLKACSYLHNYNYYSEDVLFSNKFHEVIEKYPLFTADDVDKLSDYLSSSLSKGEGLEVLQRVEQSKYRPSKKLMDHVGNIIKGKPEYILLDEQLVVYDKVLSCAKKGFHDKQKTAIIIKGGPGTGKSVIAINLMADLLLKGYNSHYATGSKAFTETLRKIIGMRGSSQFKYFNSYTDAGNDMIDVLICDEAHRIRETSASRFTKKEDRPTKPQIEELLNVAKVVVFFIDNYQIVRPNEIGSVNYLKKYAGTKKCNTFEYELEAQFRCNGSDAFVNWINNTLEIKRTANVLWDQSDEFDFKLFNTPEELKKAIDEKNKEKKNCARISAGFCWPWSEPNADGTLVKDVIIGDFKMPWEKKDKFWEWATNDSGMEQVGTVYTAQGFEFDYIGVIFGNDLTYDFDSQSWVGRKERSSDGVVKRSKKQFVDFVKNTYRVLLSRGLKGCYVHFMDKDTERFFKSRMELPKKITEEKKLELLVEVATSEKYEEYLPVYSLKAAAGKFGSGDEVQEEGWMKVNIRQKLGKSMFIARVIGHSMEPLIPNNSYCVFRKSMVGGNLVGSRQGLVVLAQHHAIDDPDIHTRYTVKRYKSEKEYNPDGTWRHTKIILEPINKEYKPIDLSAYQDEEIQIIAEFVSVVL